MTVSRCSSAVLVAAMLVAAPASRLQAQKAAASPAPTCMSMLTDAEVVKVLGPIPAAQKRTIRPGHTGCSWTRNSPLTGLTNVAADFMDLGAINALTRYVVESWGEKWPMTLPRFYDYSVRTQSEFAKVTGEPVPGVGERASLFESGGRMTIIIQRADGVATIHANVNRKDGVALARALDTP